MSQKDQHTLTIRLEGPIIGIYEWQTIKFKFKNLEKKYFFADPRVVRSLLYDFLFKRMNFKMNLQYFKFLENVKRIYTLTIRLIGPMFETKELQK